MPTIFIKTLKKTLMNNYAPILLFVYNRPNHLKQVIEALLTNKSFKSSPCYIFSDGPKSEQDKVKVDAVRLLIDEFISNNKLENIQFIKSEKNKGLANSIIDGIDQITQRYDRFIVLEDDLLVSPNFLSFMNKALDKYRNYSRVMQIAGYQLPIKIEMKEDCHFFMKTNSWAWASWKSKWKHFDNDAIGLVNQIKDIDKFNVYKSFNRFQMLQKEVILQNKNNAIHSWAILWAASVYLLDGLVLYPKHSLVQNLGHDSSGENCKKTNIYDTKINNFSIKNWPDKIEESTVLRNRITDYYKTETLYPDKPTFIQKAKNKLSKWIR